MSKDVGGPGPKSQKSSKQRSAGGVQRKPGASGEKSAGKSLEKSGAVRGGQVREFKEVVYVERGLGATFRRRWRSIIGGTALFITVFVAWGLQPLHGTIHVGICRTFIQQQIKYPDTLKLTAAEWFRNNLRLYITYIDAFGQDRSDMFECQFNPDLTLIDAKVNGQSVNGKVNGQETDIDKITAFNKTIPYVIAADPDLTIPFPPTDDLMSLKKD